MGPYPSGLDDGGCQDNGIDLYLRDDVTRIEQERGKLRLRSAARLGRGSKEAMVGGLQSAVLGLMDVFRSGFIDRAVQSGRALGVSPRSNRDAEVIASVRRTRSRDGLHGHQAVFH